MLQIEVPTSLAAISKKIKENIKRIDRDEYTEDSWEGFKQEKLKAGDSVVALLGYFSRFNIYLST